MMSVRVLVYPYLAEYQIMGSMGFALLMHEFLKDIVSVELISHN